MPPPGITSRPVVFAFRDADAFGWTERYWLNGVTAEPTRSATVLALANVRAGFLTSSCLITHIRIGADNPRDPFIIVPNFGAGIPGVYPTPTAPAEVALLIKYPAFSKGYLRIMHRGIPQAIVQADEYVRVPAFESALGAWFGAFVGQGIWHAVGALGSAGPNNQVFSATPTPPRGWQANIPGSGFAPGDVIRVSRAVVPGYNGVKTVTGFTTGVPPLAIIGGAAPAAAEVVPSAIQARKLTYYDNPITDSAIEGISRRAAGRPFGLSRGRRPTLYALRR